ncbi:hypothetical protein ASE07_20910 [Noviherbaspirillum sp. Root189]|nr:hypothetical protein ASE07_20910 [Noviherbaspirillum sp. Root189]
MGPALLTSERLDEVKAKDVFLAQESALPENRHRKLISISQGFQSVREKLKGIFAKAAAAMRQNDLFATESHSVERKSRTQPKPVAPRATLSDSFDVEGVSTSGTTNTTAQALPEIAASTADASPPNETPMKQVADQGSAPDVLATAAAKSQPAVARGDSPQSPRIARETMEPQRPRRETPPASRTPEPATDQKRPGQQPPAAMSGDFNAMLRPFIAMVAHEFAQALVNAVTKPENREALSDMVRNFTGNAGTANARHAHQGRTPAQHRSADHSDPFFVANEKLRSGNDAVPQDDDEDAEHDVQPLFDPKLPPSANSSNKPTVGVVGASAHDFDELQQMYPQLQLIAVAVDDVPHAATLGQCQRVIGLREDVPAHTDEQLRHGFRNRYLRLTGGMGRVREQLDAWLDKPGSAGPRRPKFNKPRHNNGQPDGQKKKRFGNHPRKPN